MDDLRTVLAPHREAVAAFLASARAIPSSRWSQPRAPGKWSPAQVIEHLTLAYEVNGGLLRGHPPPLRAPRLLRPLIRRFGLQPVLRRGRFIPGSKSPKVFRPSDAPPAPEQLVPRLEAATKALENAAASAGDTLDHPFFGRMPMVDFVRLQEIHTRHHHAQIAWAVASE